MWFILGLLLNVLGSIGLGYFMDFNIMVCIPMLMFNVAGICIARSNIEVK